MEVRRGQKYKVIILETGATEVKMKKNIRLMSRFTFQGNGVVACSSLGGGGGGVEG